jgi:hypothetical protein
LSPSWQLSLPTSFWSQWLCFWCRLLKFRFRPFILQL